MSISLDLRSFKNPTDKARKIADYKEYLKLQQKLNTKQEVANKAYAKGQVLGIQPQGPSRKYASAEEALQDVSQQRQDALEKLRTIFPFGDDASKVLETLDTEIPIGSRGSELNVFNTSWEDFKSELKGQKNITPNFFRQLWRRYKEKIAKTNLTGIQIPIDSTEFNTNLRTLGQQTLVEMNRLYTLSQRSQLNLYQMTARKQDEVKTAIETAIQNRDQTRLEELNKALKDGNERIINKLLQEIRPVQYSTGARQGEPMEDVELRRSQLRDFVKRAQEKVNKARRVLEQPRLSQFQKERRQRHLDEAEIELQTAQEEMARFNEEFPEGMAQAEAQAPPPREEEAKGEEEDPMFEPDQMRSKRFFPNVEVLRAYAIKYYEFPKSNQRGIPFTRADGSRDTAWYKRSLTIDKLVDYILWKRNQGLGGKKGRGMKRVFCGKGIDAKPKEKYRRFGKFVIHMPSLKNNKLNLKYPSLGYNYNTPITHISDRMKEFIYDLLDTGKLSAQHYSNLKKEEKTLFDRVAELADLDEVLGIKIDNLEKKEAMKRFEILRGELLAGNDNADLRKEMKKYLVQFIHDGLIPLREGSELLIEIACI